MVKSSINLHTQKLQLKLMEKYIEEAVMAMPVGNEEQQEVRLAIDEFEVGAKIKPNADKESFYCAKYCRGCELACPVGKSETNSCWRYVESSCKCEIDYPLFTSFTSQIILITIPISL